MDSFANLQRQHRKILSVSITVIFLALIIVASQAGYLTALNPQPLPPGLMSPKYALNPQPLPPGMTFAATSGQHIPKASPPGNQSGGNQTTPAANQTTAPANQTTAANNTDPIYITTQHAPKASPPGNQSGGNVMVSGNTTGNATGNVTSGMMKTNTTTN